MTTRFKRHLAKRYGDSDRGRPDSGQTMVEYGLLITLISVALAVVIGVGGFGTALAAYYDNIVTAL